MQCVVALPLTALSSWLWLVELEDSPGVFHWTQDAALATRWDAAGAWDALQRYSRASHPDEPLTQTRCRDLLQVLDDAVTARPPVAEAALDPEEFSHLVQEALCGPLTLEP